MSVRCLRHRAAQVATFDLTEPLRQELIPHALQVRAVSNTSRCKPQNLLAKSMHGRTWNWNGSLKNVTVSIVLARVLLSARMCMVTCCRTVSVLRGGRVRVQPYTFLTIAVDGMSSFTLRPSNFCPYRLKGRLDWSQSKSGLSGDYKTAIPLQDTEPRFVLVTTTTTAPSGATGVPLLLLLEPSDVQMSTLSVNTASRTEWRLSFLLPRI